MAQQKNRSLSIALLHRLLHLFMTSTQIKSDHEIISDKNNDEYNLKIGELLLEEFKFRGNCLLQVTSDFTGTFNLYFVLIGISISGVSVMYQLFGGIRTNALTLTVIILIIFGVANFSFFVRFIVLVRIYLRHKTCMNDIREYYLKHLSNQIADKNDAFRLTLNYSISLNYGFILWCYYFVAIVDSLCFGGAAFVSIKLWFYPSSTSLLPLPSETHPYIIVLIIIIVVLLLHILIYQQTFYKHRDIFRGK